MALSACWRAARLAKYSCSLPLPDSCCHQARQYATQCVPKPRMRPTCPLNRNPMTLTPPLLHPCLPAVAARPHQRKPRIHFRSFTSPLRGWGCHGRRATISVACDIGRALPLIHIILIQWPQEAAICPFSTHLSPCLALPQLGALSGSTGRRR